MKGSTGQRKASCLAKRTLGICQNALGLQANGRVPALVRWFVLFFTYFSQAYQPTSRLEEDR